MINARLPCRELIVIAETLLLFLSARFSPSGALRACVTVYAFYTQRCDAPLTGQVEDASWRAKFAVEVHAVLHSPEFQMVCVAKRPVGTEASNRR